MRKVLIVEDSDVFRQLLHGILRGGIPGLQLEEAADGESALKKFEVFAPDLVFMDIALPGENGLELTRKIKVTRPETSVIILTSYDMPEYRLAARECGANYFLHKGSASEADILAVANSLLSQPF
jgi:two-component system invasion response regulator UvrY